MTDFDAILQKTLDATMEKIIPLLGVLIVLLVIFTVRFIFVMKKCGQRA